MKELLVAEPTLQAALGLGLKPMNILQRRTWLAGASLIAVVLGSGDANAVIFGGPSNVYIIPSTGYYDFRVVGADGGAGDGNPGGDGAVIGGELFFDAGDILDLIVGGAGGGDQTNYGGGGGGGSFVFRGDSYRNGGLLFAAGGGGGALAFISDGNPGIGFGGHPAGPASYGGAGGLGIPNVPPFLPPVQPAQGGSFPDGGAGASSSSGFGPAGGFGGGGGGGYNTGGGGSGAPGGGGGYSYVIDTARDPFGITGGNMNGPGANGYVSIDFVGSAVPEPSTWAMTLIGFGGLGWLARLRGRKLPAA